MDVQAALAALFVLAVIVGVSMIKNFKRLAVVVVVVAVAVAVAVLSGLHEL